MRPGGGGGGGGGGGEGEGEGGIRQREVKRGREEVGGERRRENQWLI